MSRIVLIALASALLSSCASVGDELRDELAGYVGQNVKSVIVRIGYPTSQQTVLGDTVFVWNTNPGKVDFNWGDVNLYCTIQLATSSDGLIKTFHYSGNNGGCQRWTNALSR